MVRFILISNLFLSHGLNLPVEIINLVVKSISHKLLYLVKIHLSYNSTAWQIPNLVIGGINIMDIKCNNSHIRKCLTCDVSCYPKALIEWKKFFFKLSTEKIWLASNKCLLPNKAKENNLRYCKCTIPVTHLIFKFRKDVSPKFSFCNLENETHLFCNSKIVWRLLKAGIYVGFWYIF